MKRLFIVRHGKSSWELESVRDIDRTLKERGIMDAYKMASRLQSAGLVPKKIVSSSAARAFHSAVIFHRVLNMPPGTFSIEPGLYAADTEEILNIVYSFDDDDDSIMIFGHNPGFTDLANELSRLNISNVPTTGVVVLDFDIGKWTEIGRDRLVKEHFDYPRNA